MAPLLLSSTFVSSLHIDIAPVLVPPADVSSLQQPDGSFAGDEWGEIDTRFSYCALLCQSILDRMDGINVDQAVQFIVTCKNFDGGFGCTPGV